jgi:hypothetical protein
VLQRHIRFEMAGHAGQLPQDLPRFYSHCKRSGTALMAKPAFASGVGR